MYEHSRLDCECRKKPLCTVPAQLSLRNSQPDQKAADACLLRFRLLSLSRVRCVHVHEMIVAKAKFCDVCSAETNLGSLC